MFTSGIDTPLNSLRYFGSSNFSKPLVPEANIFGQPRLHKACKRSASFLAPIGHTPQTLELKASRETPAPLFASALPVVLRLLFHHAWSGYPTA